MDNVEPVGQRSQFLVAGPELEISTEAHRCKEVDIQVAHIGTHQRVLLDEQQHLRMLCDRG